MEHKIFLLFELEQQYFYYSDFSVCQIGYKIRIFQFSKQEHLLHSPYYIDTYSKHQVIKIKNLRQHQKLRKIYFFPKPKFPIQSQRRVWFLNEYCVAINCHKSYFFKTTRKLCFPFFFLKNTKVAFRNFCLIHDNLPIKILYINRRHY